MEGQNPSLAPEARPAHVISLPTPTQFNLPGGWVSIEIGLVSNHYAEFINPRFNLSGSANGFAAQGDNSWFVFKNNITNEIRATLILDQPILAGSMCGVMTRESEKSNSAFLFIGFSPSKIIVCRRDVAGHFDSVTNEIPNYQRLGKKLFFHVKIDGKNIVPELFV